MLVYTQIIDIPQDKSKFERIYLEYRNIMFYVANRILNNEQDAEDSVHQAFIKIAENIDKVPDVLSKRTKSFVITIAENTAIDFYRKRQRHQNCDFSEDEYGYTVEYEGENELTRCILELPARYREVILLKYYNGYSTREIAKILGISFSAASKLDQRAKQKLELLCKEVELL